MSAASAHHRVPGTRLPSVSILDPTHHRATKAREGGIREIDRDRAIQNPAGAGGGHSPTNRRRSSRPAERWSAGVAGRGPRRGADSDAHGEKPAGGGDPQGTFSARTALRRARLGERAIGFDFAALTGWRAAMGRRSGRAMDLVLIDAPPHAEGGARIAVRAARLVMVPAQQLPLDLWATAETLKMAQREQRQPFVILNRVPSRSRLTEDIAADLASAGTPIAATRIGNRVGLPQAMARGLGVIENARMNPAAETSPLADEIRRALSG